MTNINNAIEKLPKKNQIAKSEKMTVEEVVKNADFITEIQNKVMKQDIHFGIIPGCKKPSLLKSGAEKLCVTFRLQPEFSTILRVEDPDRVIDWEKKYGNKLVKGQTKGFYEFASNCRLINIVTGQLIASASGSCNNFEKKYCSQSPYDIRNTVEKMAEKRALIAATLLATGASDVFTQDIEDLADSGVIENKNNKSKSQVKTQKLSQTKLKLYQLIKAQINTNGKTKEQINTEMADVLRVITTFQNEDGKTIEGVKSFFAKNFSDKWAESAYKTYKKEIEKAASAKKKTNDLVEKDNLAVEDPDDFGDMPDAAW